MSKSRCNSSQSTSYFPYQPSRAPPPGERSQPGDAQFADAQFADAQFAESKASASDALDFEFSETIAQRYQVARKLASGGMGEVFSARDLVLRRTVALKVLLKRLQGDARLQRRFVEEALIMGDLQHPGVTPIFDLGELPDGRPFFAMKLVEGASLRDLLGRRTHPREDLARHLQILEDVSQTIAFAHMRRVIHRDLKPLNIMVGIFGEVFVMDWGLSKRLSVRHDLNDEAVSETDGQPDGAGAHGDPRRAPSSRACTCDSTDELSRWGEILGTLDYLAPEQLALSHQHGDEQTDVFGLGAMLCEVLTGKPPYWHESSQEAIRMALAAELAPAYARLSECGLPRNLVNLAIDCLQYEPSRRPPNAGIVAKVIAQHLESSVRMAESDLARFFEFSQDLFCIAGFDGFFRRVNPTFARILGFTEDQMLARPFIELVHPEDRLATESAVARLATDVPVVAFFNRCVDVNGHYHTLEWSGKSNQEQDVFYAVGRVIRHAP